MTAKPLITVVIPSKNGDETLGRCLQGIEQQILYPRTEILVIDSGSTDNTVDIVKKHPRARLHSIDPTTFNHGATRNLGVKLATTEFVVMTVQDAAPVGDTWLSSMLENFNDPEVAGVCGQQIIPHRPDYNPHEWYRPQSKPGIKEFQYGSKQEFNQLSPQELSSVCRWDDVNAMYRREILLKIPFREVMFGEDMSWAYDALSQGYKIIYNNFSQVEHYHHVNYDYAYRRTLTTLYFRYQFFGVKNFSPRSAKDYLKVIYRNLKFGAHPRWIPYNWTALRAYNRAVADFHRAQRRGEEYLTKFYNSVCSTAPQAKVTYTNE